ncbi:hypothetical protein D1007_09491 [Hordeum vulgare]|nr:hypothetical protein D1007_09491 [Hordeum vulgare]
MEVGDLYDAENPASALIPILGSDQVIPSACRDPEADVCCSEVGVHGGSDAGLPENAVLIPALHGPIIEAAPLEAMERSRRGPSFDGFDYLPACETRGGILLAWDRSVMDVDGLVHDTDSLSGLVHNKDGTNWWITVLYGPQGDEFKTTFLEELRARRLVRQEPWMVLGDFNMILHASEKNNANLNRRMMQRFRGFVDSHELIELYMHTRNFTWSNEWDSPTMMKIDRLEGFEEAVREAWTCDEEILDPFKRLDALLRNTAMDLQARRQRKIGNLKNHMAVANWLIARIDRVQEARLLYPGELWLRRTVKRALLGLASLERTIERHRSRIRWIKEGDADTELFQAVANGRRSKNFIAHVRHNGVIRTDQDRKEEIFSEAYEWMLRRAQAREDGVNLDFIGIQVADL